MVGQYFLLSDFLSKKTFLANFGDFQLKLKFWVQGWSPVCIFWTEKAHFECFCPLRKDLVTFDPELFVLSKIRPSDAF